VRGRGPPELRLRIERGKDKKPKVESAESEAAAMTGFWGSDSAFATERKRKGDDKASYFMAIFELQWTPELAPDFPVDHSAR
jgi:hypothetical protein